ncbi:MAG: hypothetical protein LBM17_06350 [Candidatus Accumulibacter sp.]|nr:hypothetical protein [Accumulibacter sp.]
MFCQCGEPSAGRGENLVKSICYISRKGKKVPKPIVDYNFELQTKVVGGTAYAVYGCIRMVPSLFPPLGPTIPGNVLIP